MVAVVVTGADVAPKPNAPTLPPNEVVDDVFVVLPEPNVNAFVAVVVDGAVVVKLLPNVKGLALVVVVFVDAPKENIF